MTSSRDFEAHVGRPFGENRLLQALLAAYVLVFALAAIAPHDRGDWLLENLLVLVFAPVLALTHRRFTFSNLSYLSIFAFLVLHAVGSHYTYSLTPPGFWIQDTFGLDRNPYDRIVHFAFGLLLTYPLREIGRRVLHLRGAWSYLVPFLAVLSISASYEIVESWAARIVDPELGTAFLGTQGDEWDAQKDMSLAMTGSIISLAVTAAFWRFLDREPWTLLQRAH